MGRRRYPHTWVVLVIAEDGTQSVYGTWRTEEKAETLALKLQAEGGDGTDAIVHMVMTA